MKKLVLAFLVGLIATWAVPFVQAQSAQPPVVGRSINDPGNHANKADSSKMKARKADKKEHPPVFITCVESTWKGSDKQENRRLKREDEDLKQQVRMAKASEDAASWTFWGICVSAVAVGISLGVGIYSLCQAGRIHKTTIREMRIAERRARNKDQMELRAYVAIRKKEIIGVPDFNKIFDTGLFKEWVPLTSSIVYRFRIRNHGQTLAKKMEWRARIDVSTYPDPVETDVDIKRISSSDKVLDGTISQRDIPPDDPDGAIAEARFENPLTEDQVKGLKDKKMAVYIYGYITYKDVFGKRRISKFRYMHVNIEDKFGENLVICPKGNEIE